MAKTLTFEEQNLVGVYNAGTRDGTVAALKDMQGYIAAEETELRELTASAVKKLLAMTDEEYAVLDLYPEA